MTKEEGGRRGGGGGGGIMRKQSLWERIQGRSIAVREEKNVGMGSGGTTLRVLVT